MKFQNLDLVNETVEHVFFDEVTTVSLRAVEARRLAMHYMAWNGVMRDYITEEQHRYIYENLCDGFGLGGQPNYYDWSHVRDSSWEAFLNIAQYLNDQHKFDFNDLYTRHLEMLRAVAEEDGMLEALECLQ